MFGVSVLVLVAVLIGGLRLYQYEKKVRQQNKERACFERMEEQARQQGGNGVPLDPNISAVYYDCMAE